MYLLVAILCIGVTVILSITKPERKRNKWIKENAKIGDWFESIDGTERTLRIQSGICHSEYNSFMSCFYVGDRYADPDYSSEVDPWSLHERYEKLDKGRQIKLETAYQKKLGCELAARKSKAQTKAQVSLHRFLTEKC